MKQRDTRIQQLLEMKRNIGQLPKKEEQELNDLIFNNNKILSTESVDK